MYIYIRDIYICIYILDIYIHIYIKYIYICIYIYITKEGERICRIYMYTYDERERKKTARERSR